MSEQQNHAARMRSYLLGRLSEDEALALDEESLADQQARLDFWEAEALLIEDYVHDRLSSADRASFETNYMATLRNQEHVSLIAGLAAAPRRRVPVPIQMTRPRPVWQIPAAAVLAIGIGVSSWQVSHSRQLDRATLKDSNRQLALASSNLHDAQMKLAVAESNRLAVFTLEASERGAGQPAPIVIPSGATEVTLVVPRDLDLPKPAAAVLYREAADGLERIATPRIFVPSQLPYALVYVNAQLLQPGPFQIELQGRRRFAFKISQK